jgi:8-oxo-dGTP diphosphatase
LKEGALVASNPTYVLVVAAAIFGADGRLLLQQRPAGKRHAGLWELPGGKVEAVESPRFALFREVQEELGIELEIGSFQPAGFAEEAPDDGRPGLVLLLYRCARWSGVPQGLEGQTWDWFTPEEALRLDLAPMDRRLLGGEAG